MATDEQQPLLRNSDYDENSVGRLRLYQSNNLGLETESGRGDLNRIAIPKNFSTSSLEGNDLIVAIFVVAFDTRSGNMIEWCMPEDTDLDGVEFKSMPSGSHTLERDFVNVCDKSADCVESWLYYLKPNFKIHGILHRYLALNELSFCYARYFRKDNMYGLSCFENMPVESEIERGARMKSVGILSYSYTNLYRHMQFLEMQVRHQLEIPGKYTQLIAFYNDKKGELPLNVFHSNAGHIPSPLSTPSTPSLELLPEMKITHPAGCFAQFIKFFGEHVFTLWKFALLQRRIIFFSPPPIGVVCYRVYCACCLASHRVQGLGTQELRPHFYVSVADIEALENEVSYVACTTEKIFESKTQLYDIYVDNQNVFSSSHALKDLLKITDADREKLAKLNNQRNQYLFNLEELGEDIINEEELILAFFMELNERLFQTLLDISMSQDRQLTSDHVKAIGLDPVGDRTFLMELVEHYGIDVVLMVDNPCCPK